MGSGLTFDFGQAVLDDEIVRMIKHLRQGIAVNAETLSVDLIDEIGPFGEFLSHDTTLSKMRSLSQTHLFDRNNRRKLSNWGRTKVERRQLMHAFENKTFIWS
jgi:trimethylamine--corrinoid protein Co-methyltransferase